MTEREVRIVQLDLPALRALARGDLEAARAASGLPLTPWLVSEECLATWRMRADQVGADAAEASWVTGIVVAGTEVVGRAGFHGAPSAGGTVEVGYAIDPHHRRRGYARAALALMLERARADRAVSSVLASVRPDNEPSLRLISQFGFRRRGEHLDEVDGLEWVFGLECDTAAGGVAPSP